MKNIVLLIFAVLLGFSNKAQNTVNPYASIGKPAPLIVSVTNGNYDEFFIKDSVVLICSEAVSRKTGETVYSSKTDGELLTLLEKRQEDKFRFLSVDPKTADYPYYTPYQFAGNEPIAAIDLDGLEPAYVIGGNYVTARDGALQRPLSQQGLDHFNGNGYGAPQTLEGESAMMDAIPFVGAAKGWVEAATGRDLLTGEEIPAWVRAASIIPYGKFSKYLKHADDVMDEVAKHGDEAIDFTKNVVEKNADDAEGIIYKRTDKTGGQKDYIGQTKSDSRYMERQKEHARANPDAKFEFEVVERGKPGKDLNLKEQKHIDAGGGPTNKSNPNGGLSNKKNVIKKE